MNNKRGQAIFFLLMMGTVFFLLGLALAPGLKQVTSDAMGVDQLNCSNPNITDQRQAICTGTDILQFLFTGVVFGLGGLLIGAIALR